VSEEKVVMSPGELENFSLLCVVCGGEIPKARAHRRSRGSASDTCCAEHFDLVKQWRKHMARNYLCHSCLAPYSLKQREDFRRWRVETGQMRGKRGKVSSREQKLEAALAAATAELKASLEMEFNSICDNDGLIDENEADKSHMELLEALIAQCEAALIAPPPNPRVNPRKPKKDVEPKEVDTAEPDQDMISASAPAVS
jgi:hypothetical protein